jgi:hypothetical protein
MTLRSFRAITHNNAGGFLARRVGAAAVMSVHIPKLVVATFWKPSDQEWSTARFRPVLIVAAVGNTAIVFFYCYWAQRFAAEAQQDEGVRNFVLAIVGVLLAELLAMQYSMVGTTPTTPANATSGRPILKDDWVVASFLSTLFCLMTVPRMAVAVRDLFLPGRTLHFIPYDDINLQLLSNLEANNKQSVASDLFLSQLHAVHVLILCLYRFVTAVMWIRHGKDRYVKATIQMIWACLVVGDIMINYVLRIMTPAAAHGWIHLQGHRVWLALEGALLVSTVRLFC